MSNAERPEQAGAVTADGNGEAEPGQRAAETWSGQRPPRLTIPPLAAFGRYTVLRHLGTGAMGEVYLARDDSLKRDVALKLLHREHFERDDLRARFRREARAVAQVAHPNVVSVFDIDEHEGRPFLVMEFLMGEDAQQMLEARGKIEPRTAAAIGLGAARGLAEAAAAKVVHRDIKPANLFVTDRQVVKVTDFGLAKAASRAVNTSAEMHLTLQGTTLGTPDYMSPEAARGDEVDHRADVYGLGCTLYHLVSGKPPFRELDEKVNYMEVIGRHVADPIPSLRGLPDVPIELAELVSAMMAKRPDARPSYEQVIAALRTLAKGKGTLPPLGEGTGGELVAEGAELLRARLSGKPLAATPPRRGRWLIWLTLASALLFAGSLALWLLG